MSKRSSSHHHHHYTSSRSSKSTEQNLHVNEDHPEFYVSSNNYDIVFVNNQTNSNTMNLLLRHVRFNRQYSIDTESDQRSNKLSLIQLNSMPVRDKSVVILIELEQLPHQDSIEYEKIRELFRFLFREENELFSWRDMKKELEPRKDLFTWPIPAVLVNLQLYFPEWYSWGLSQCRGMTLTHRDDVNDDKNQHLQQHQQRLTCSCHLQSPYNPGELWSLKNALKYGCKLFIDKSARLGNWSSSLTSSSSSLSYQTQKKMIRYAVYDVLAVSFLARPIAEKWTFDQVKDRSMEEVICGFNSIKFPQLSIPKEKKKKIKNLNLGTLSKIMSRLDSDLESISSDDEIYVSQMNEQSPVNYQQKKNDDELNEINGEALLIQENTFDNVSRLISTKDKPGEPDDDVELYEEIKLNVSEEDRLLIDENAQVQVNHVNLNLNIEFLDINDKLNDELQMDVDNRLAVVNEVISSPTNTKEPIKIKKTRSREARKKRNKKHNTQLRTRRYQFPLYRNYYYKVTAQIARRILQHYDVPIRHIKVIKDNQYLIGTKNGEVQRRFDQELPQNCFDKHHFERFRKRLY